MTVPRYRMDFWHRALAYHRVMLASAGDPVFQALYQRGIAVKRAGPVRGKAIYRITRYGLETAQRRWKSYFENG